MANHLQKFIYNISAAAPICVSFGVVWYMQEKTWIVPLICGMTCILLVIAFVVSFSYGTKHLATISIRASDISPNDSWFILYLFTYLLPFSSIVIDDLELGFCGIAAIIVIIVAPFVNSAIPNPFLFFRKYHFYQVSGENGISEYVLISKRIFRKKQDLRLVNQMFDFMLLDVEGR